MVPGEKVRVKGKTLYVQEFPHAYLVRGPGIMWGPSVDQCRLAVFEYLGRKKWKRIEQMPTRPLFTSEVGDKKPCGAVALYFSIAKSGDCRYKP